MPQNAAFTKGQTSHLHLLQGEIINFNKNITIINSAFDTNGAFICQQPGIYSFNMFSLTMSDVNVWLELFKNDQIVASLFGNTPHDYADAGNSVILHLNAEDRIDVRAHSNYTTHLFGTTDQVYTTFTGVLLSPDFQIDNQIGKREAFSVGLTHHFHLEHGEVVALWLELYHNDDYVNSAFGHTPSRYADAGNCAILHLRKDDTVYIKGRNEYGIDLYGTSDEIYDTFSGSLLTASSFAYPEIGSSTDEEVAFSVGLTHTMSGTKLIFDRIFINIGNGYHETTGVFNAPKSGIYVFYYYALSTQNKVIYVDLYHNYHYVNSLYGHISNGYANGGNAATLELMSGDTVYIKVRDTNSEFYGSSDEIYCTFSGHFVSPSFKFHPGPIG
ncbi:hypothetical protein FSP39_017952 [Pinctada imbricata]|uniref:C1q domain-containing protein n=1 Tax=Pinctada imbricata TaxID=66713 RepID=A0AA88YC53_PINIB|nr:hypothetical protein FSP39_017952 [Pinctada imbricata]